MKSISLQGMCKIRDACEHLQRARDLVNEVYDANLEFAGDKFRRNPDINMLEHEIKLTNKLLTVIEKR